MSVGTLNTVLIKMFLEIETNISESNFLGGGLVMRKLLPIMLILSISLTSCVNKNSVGTPDSQSVTSQSGSVQLSATDHADKISLKMITRNGHNGYGTDKGYYYIPSEMKNDAEGNAYNSIMYIDYATKKEIPLCNKPNCKHDSDSCTSYLGFVEGNPVLFTNGDKLYLVHTDSGSSGTMTGTGDLSASLSVRAPKVCQMNLDGSNKTTLFTLESGYTFSEPYVISDSSLYLISNKMETVKKDNGSYSISAVSSKVISIDLSSKKVSEIADVKDQRIIGAYGQTLVLMKTQFERELSNEEIYNDNIYFSELKKAKAVFSTLDVTTGEIQEHGRFSFPDVNSVVVNDNRILFSAYNDNKIQYLDLSNDKTGSLAENISPAISSLSNEIYDGKLLYYHWNGNSGGSTIDSYYCVDCLRGEIQAINLFTSGIKADLSILAKTADSFLVISGMDTKDEYVAYVGVTQTSITGYHYAFIKKTDFFAGNAVYTAIDGTA